MRRSKISLGPDAPEPSSDEPSEPDSPEPDSPEPDSPEPDSSEPDDVNSLCDVVGDRPEIQSNRWTLGGAPPGGWIARMIAHPLDNDVIWAGSQMNGLYLSTDGGWTWQDRSPETTHVISIIAVDPSNTQTAMISNDFGFITQNSGLHWNRLNASPPGQMVQALSSMAWFQGSFAVFGQWGTVKKSDDNGSTFSELSIINSPNIVPTHEDHGGGFDYGSRIRMDDVVHAALFVCHSKWGWLVPLTKWCGLGSDFACRGPLAHGLAVVEGDEYDTVYVALDQVNGVYELIRSDDDGSSWSRNVGQFQDKPLWLAAASEKLAVLTESAIHFWENEQFVTRSGPTLSESFTGTWLNDGSFIVGHLYGISRSSDNGQTYVSVSENIKDTDQSSLGQLTDCPGLLFAGTQCELGGFYSTDWGQTWTWIETYLHYVMTWVDNPSRAGEFWVVSDRSAYKSVDYGERWTDMIPNNLEVHFHGIAIDPFNADRVLLGSVGSGLWNDQTAQVYISENGGISWSVSNVGLPQTESSIHSLHFSETNFGVVLMGTYYGGDIITWSPNRYRYLPVQMVA